MRDLKTRSTGTRLKRDPNAYFLILHHQASCMPAVLYLYLYLYEYEYVQ
jgi:hypothetical protein